MRRADRLFEIIQVLRRTSRPVTAEAIATELEVNKRTAYRDIAALMAQRVPINGVAGIGYVLDSGFDLPPLMLTADEIEAVSLGAQWVMANADPGLARAARDVLAKVRAILPDRLRPLMEEPVIGTPTPKIEGHGSLDLPRVRGCCRERRKLAIVYVDEQGRSSERVTWPFMVGYMTGSRAVIAWCELRSDFRVFLTDRIASLSFLDEHYPERPKVLRRRWMQLICQRESAMEQRKEDSDDRGV